MRFIILTVISILFLFSSCAKDKLDFSTPPKQGSVHSLNIEPLTSLLKQTVQATEALSVNGLTRCRPGSYPSINSPGVCCTQPNYEHCIGGVECAIPGWCQGSNACYCMSCNNRKECCKEWYSCALNSNNEQTCCSPENVCNDVPKNQELCGLPWRDEKNIPLPPCCDNVENFCDLGENNKTFSCQPLRRCIWDDPSCELPPMAPPHVPEIDDIALCLKNPKSEKCMIVSGQTCSGKDETYSIPRKRFCSLAITYAKAPFAKETVKFMDGCIPPGWKVSSTVECLDKHRPNNESNNLMLGRYLYRVLREDEAEEGRIFPKDSSKRYKPDYHVTRGSTVSTQFISTSTNYLVNVGYCSLFKARRNRSIMVQLSVAEILKLGCKLLDVSTGAGLHPNNKRARSFARVQQEVLIYGKTEIVNGETVYTPCEEDLTEAIKAAGENCSIYSGVL